MDEPFITEQVGELAEYARVLDAAFGDRDPILLKSVADQLERQVRPLSQFLESGPRPWKVALAGAWIATNSVKGVLENLAIPPLDWDQIGAAVSFTVSGVEQLSAAWTRILSRST